MIYKEVVGDIQAVFEGSPEEILEYQNLKDKNKQIQNPTQESHTQPEGSSEIFARFRACSKGEVLLESDEFFTFNKNVETVGEVVNRWRKTLFKYLKQADRVELLEVKVLY